MILEKLLWYIYESLAGLYWGVVALNVSLIVLFSLYFTLAEKHNMSMKQAETAQPYIHIHTDYWTSG